MHRIARRSLLAAGGTLLAAVAARKYLFAADAGAGDLPPAPPSGPETQSLDALKPLQPAALLPPLSFTLADGSTRSLSDYAGDGVVLNFWATWCAPCVSEMPALDVLSRALAKPGRNAGSPGGRRIVVLPVSLDRGGADAVGPFYAGHGLRSLPVLLDPHSTTMTALRLDGIPTTLVIDRNGREVARVQGPVRWDDPEAAAVIARLVG